MRCRYERGIGMTKEEALKILDTIPTISEQVDALEMAIKALEQQPCEDVISRQAAIDAIYKKYIGGKGAIKNAPINDLYADGLEEAVDAVWDMPSVTPKTKTGQWEYVQYDTPNIGNWHCSRCRGLYYSTDKPRWKYCPSCGARMEESEGKDGNTM